MDNAPFLNYINKTMTNLIWPNDDSSVVSWIKLGLVHKINEVGLKYASEWVRSSVSRLVVFDKKKLH